MSNRLKNETSPYLLQHADNPVNWYPWGSEAFAAAQAEDKPVFLSIGYSTCHWCHVMARESFADQQTAELINRWFIPIKVDREERPDIDSIYMTVCQAFTGSGGWPTSIFMTPEQKPFFAGTYFPKTARRGSPGLQELLTVIHDKWENDRELLLQSANEVITLLAKQRQHPEPADKQLITNAVLLYKHNYDQLNGGFGTAPKFPAPHNLLFLLNRYEKGGDKACLAMAEKTLEHMYRGGLFDHIGGGFCRYSTDQRFLVPHFEKMLYDNALLIMAYCKAYQLTGKPLYCDIAHKTARYVLREMTNSNGGFYSAQDADSEGQEGKYYVFTPAEIIKLLGPETGTYFNQYFAVTQDGNFEGQSIPNLLHNADLDQDFAQSLSLVYDYRRQRHQLNLDDKILTSWNSLMIAALCLLYRLSRQKEYLAAARKAQQFIDKNLCEKDALYVSYRHNKRSSHGFLDDYANYTFALLHLYEATLNHYYLEKALVFCQKTLAVFSDQKQGGFYLSGYNNEPLIYRPQETYDGALPSGNSIMAWILVRLSYMTQDEQLEQAAKRQLDFMAAAAKDYPAGYAMFLLALSEYLDPPEKIVVVPADSADLHDLPLQVAPGPILLALEQPAENYPLKNHKTTFYVCQGQHCLPPANQLPELLTTSAAD